MNTDLVLAAQLRCPVNLGGRLAAFAHHNVIHLLLEVVIVREQLLLCPLRHVFTCTPLDSLQRCVNMGQRCPARPCVHPWHDATTPEALVHQDNRNTTGKGRPQHRSSPSDLLLCQVGGGLCPCSFQYPWRTHALPCQPHTGDGLLRACALLKLCKARKVCSIRCT